MPESVTISDGSSAIRLLCIADLLGQFAVLMEEQSGFHEGPGMDGVLESARYAANMAQRRVASTVYAGPRWLRQIERTLLSELIRASSMALDIMDEAGSEAWDFRKSMEGAATALSESARRDITLFLPNEKVQGDLPPLSPVGEDFSVKWSACADAHVAVGPLGIPLSIVPFEGGGYLSLIGFTAVGLSDTASAAAKRCERLAKELFENRSSLVKVYESGV